MILALAATLVVFGVGLHPRSAFARSPAATLPEFAPCTPESDDSDELTDGQGRPLPGSLSLSADFCAEWNPEFPFNGHRCCSKVKRAKGSRRRRRLPAKVCTSDRFKPNFCDDITDEQREYAESVASGRISDVLSVIDQEMGRKGDQAFCTVNNGFLAWGRPVVPTPGNRIQIRATDRCTNFGTDSMIGMIEWVGREVDREYGDPRHEGKYAGLKLLVGDIAAPRGGCLAGRSGPKGHASHTNGLDADIGFLLPRPGKESPGFFFNEFDAKANWWLVKQFFKNPYACVKVIFLDKKHIAKLRRIAQKEKDEDWDRYGRYVRHVPSHRNHLHVRIGDGPGQPGCTPGADPDDEHDDEHDELGGPEESVDLEALDLPRIEGPKPASTSFRTKGR